MSKKEIFQKCDIQVVKSYKEDKNNYVNNFLKMKTHKVKFNDKISINSISNTNYKNDGKIVNRLYTITNFKKDLHTPRYSKDKYLYDSISNNSNLNGQIILNSKRAFTMQNNKINNKKKFLMTTNNLNSNLSKRNLSSHKNDQNNRVFNKNTISYIDRNKIKKLNTMTLKLYEIYLQRKNQTFKAEEQEDADEKETFFNPKKNITNNFLYENFNTIENNGLTQNSNKHISMNSSISKPSKDLFPNYKKKLRKFKTERKYGLKQLMEFNPYHYVSNIVRYSNSIEMRNISEKLSNVSGAAFNKKATSKQLFFKNENYTHEKRIQKVINVTSVSLNKNLSIKGGLIWRILGKISKSNGASSFYHACKFKGYSELWKHYSILIEQLLVKYPEFKWFLEKTKYMKEEVFEEFLTCMKIEIKNDKTFPKKVFLLFDEDCAGEINMKIFFFIMELTSTSGSESEKLNFYTELFTELKLKNSVKCIKVLELYEIFKHLVNSQNYKKDCKFLYELLKGEFNDGEKIDNNLYISKKQLYYFLLNNKYIHKLMQLFLIQYKFADITYNEEINSSFNSTIRNVKKFLNQQNDITKMSINECNNLENVLKAVQNKDKIKTQLKNEFSKTLNSEESFEK